MEYITSEPISVEILDREYQFACKAGEREALKAAAARSLELGDELGK